MNFAIPGCLGEPKQFAKEIGNPILRSRDLDATDHELRLGRKASAAFTRKLDAVMLRRTNEVIAKYLPAKLDVNVFCTLCPEQQAMYLKQCRYGLKAYDGTYSSAFQTVTILRKIVNDPEAAAQAQDAQEAQKATAAAAAAAAALQQQAQLQQIPQMPQALREDGAKVAGFDNPFAPSVAASNGAASGGTRGGAEERLQLSTRWPCRRRRGGRWSQLKALRSPASCRYSWPCSWRRG